MGLFDKMKSMETNYTKTEKQIYAYIMNNMDIAVRDNLLSISELSGFSAASLTRYAKKLGFSGYDEFKYELQRDNLRTISDNEEKQLSDQYAKAFKEVEKRYPDKELEKLAKVLYNANHIFVTGFHNSSIPAKQFTFRLEELRYTTSFLPYDEAFKLDAFARSNDVLIIYSVHSAIYRELVKNLRAMGEKAPTIILFCTDPKHVLKTKVDYSYVMPDEHTIGYDHCLDPTIIYTYFNNLLIHVLDAKD